jgi:demethylmenaquinone methyltransferase/2-methoxy-6-polyprenyl-1,4-benzoquinol methylase
VDFCHEMLVLETRRASGLGAAAPRVVEADALALPFRDGLYDGAAVAFGVRNFEDLDRGLAEAARVIRSGGTLAVLEFGRPRGLLLGGLYRLYLGRIVPLVGRLVAGAPAAYGYLSCSIQGFEDQAAFPRRLERAGFTSIRCTDLTGGIAALYTARKP